MLYCISINLTGICCKNKKDVIVILKEKVLEILRTSMLMLTFVGTLLELFLVMRGLLWN